VNVLLPDGYDGKRRFPVLYLLHGHGDSYQSWAKPDAGNAAEITRNLGAIVVMPEAGRGWYANWWENGTRSPKWEGFFLDELIPIVERRLRVRPARRWHAVAGLSMGGEGAMYLASQLPGYFGSAAAFSGSLSIQRPEWPQGFDTQGERHEDVFGDPDAQRFYWTGHNPTALTGNLHDTRLFVAVGDGTNSPDVLAEDPSEATNYFGPVAEADLHMHADDFVAAARASGDDVTYAPQQGIHDWPYWRKHLAQAIKWGLFAQVPDKPRAWKYTTVQQRGDAWGYHFLFTQPPNEVETIQLAGGRIKATGSGTARVRTPTGARFTATLPFDRPVPVRHRRTR
jgi:S-formylglutathione hydrolase FrmB